LAHAIAPLSAPATAMSEKERLAAGGAARSDAAEHRSDAASATGAAFARNPEEAAGWLSQLFFTYVNGIVDLGQAKTLQHEDLWPVAGRDAAVPTASRFHLQLASTRTPEAPKARARARVRLLRPRRARSQAPGRRRPAPHVLSCRAARWPFSRLPATLRRAAAASPACPSPMRLLLTPSSPLALNHTQSNE